MHPRPLTTIEEAASERIAISHDPVFRYRREMMDRLQIVCAMLSVLLILVLVAM